MESMAEQLDANHSGVQPQRGTTPNRLGPHTHAPTTINERRPPLATGPSQLSIHSVRSTPQAAGTRHPHSLCTKTRSMATRLDHAPTTRPLVSDPTHPKLASALRTPTTQNNRKTDDTTSPRSSLRCHLEPVVHPTKVPTSRPLPSQPRNTTHGRLPRALWFLLDREETRD